MSRSTIPLLTLLAFSLASLAAAQREPSATPPDARALLRAAEEATRAPQTAVYRADLEIASERQPAPIIARAARIELGARLPAANGPFQRPFRIEGEWMKEPEREPFTVAFDGQTVRYPLAAGKLFIEERVGAPGLSFLEPYLLLLPGWSDASALQPAADAEVSCEARETVSGALCDLVLVRRAMPKPATEAAAPERWMESRIAIGVEDHLPRRWTSALTEIDGGERRQVFRSSATILEHQLGDRIAPERFVLTAPEGYKVARPPGGSESREGSTLAVGEAAPAWTLTDAAGRQHALADLRGKVVVLDFWATWCAPCKRAMPGLQSLHERFAAKGLVVAGIDIRDTGDPAAYMRDKAFTYLLLLKGDEVAKAYGVSGIPHVVVIAPDGTIAHQSVGYTPDLEERLARAVEGLLAKR